MYGTNCRLLSGYPQRQESGQVSILINGLESGISFNRTGVREIGERDRKENCWDNGGSGYDARIRARKQSVSRYLLCTR